jgi:hypothetical protein
MGNGEYESILFDFMDDIEKDLFGQIETGSNIIRRNLLTIEKVFYLCSDPVNP